MFRNSLINLAKSVRAVRTPIFVNSNAAFSTKVFKPTIGLRHTHDKNCSHSHHHEDVSVLDDITMTNPDMDNAYEIEVDEDMYSHDELPDVSAVEIPEDKLKFYHDFAIQAYESRSTIMLFHVIDILMRNNNSSFLNETLSIDTTEYYCEDFFYGLLVGKDLKPVSIHQLTTGQIDMEDPYLQILTQARYVSKGGKYLEFFFGTKFDPVIYNYLLDTTKRLAPLSFNEPNFPKFFESVQGTCHDLAGILKNGYVVEKTEGERVTNQDPLSIPLGTILQIFHENPAVLNFMDFPITLDYLQYTLGDVKDYKSMDLMQKYHEGNPNINSSTTVVVNDVLRSRTSTETLASDSLIRLTFNKDKEMKNFDAVYQSNLDDLL